jgi:hypothetical protein
MSPGPSRQGTVALSMDIRSILKKRLAGKDQGDDMNEPSRVQPAASSYQSNEEYSEPQPLQQEIYQQQKLTPAPLRMGETSPGSGVVDAARINEDESIQDKINRVKSGKMTEEEKRAFLATALSAGMSPESRKPLIEPKRDAKSFSASPFPSDSILRNIVSGKVKQQTRDTDQASIRLDLNTDAKKKEYLDMVTDPDRFTRRIKPKAASNLAPPPMASFPPSWSPPRTQPVATGYVDNNLGARLGAYAMEEEVRRREAEKQRLRNEQERQREQEAHAERERQMALQRQAEEQ